MNKKQVRAMMKKPWWNYALLIAGVFLFTEGCSLLYGSDELSIQISVILFSMIMHGTSLRDLSKSILLKSHDNNTKQSDEKNNIQHDQALKDKASLTANIIVQILLVIVAVSCYYIEFKITDIILFDIFIIIIYGIISVISYKFYRRIK
nr:hypothetical protein [Sedimentibacter sp.]